MLQPNTIKKIWSALRYGLEQALPPTADQHFHSYTEILAEMMSGKAQCWVIYYTEDEQPCLCGFAVTFLRPDPLTKSKYLHVYAIYAFDSLEDEDWDRLYAVMIKFAKINNCSAITAFTNQHIVASQIKRLGGKSDWEYWYKEI